MINFDMALYKDFRIKERHTIEFRSKFFNIFSTPTSTALARVSEAVISGK